MNFQNVSPRARIAWKTWSSIDCRVSPLSGWGRPCPPRTRTTQPSPWSPTRRKFSGRELDLPILPSERTPPSLFIRHYLFTLLSYTLWRGPSPLDAKYIVPDRKIVVFSSLFSRVIFLMSPQIVCLK